MRNDTAPETCEHELATCIIREDGHVLAHVASSMTDRGLIFAAAVDSRHDQWGSIIADDAANRAVQAICEGRGVPAAFREACRRACDTCRRFEASERLSLLLLRTGTDVLEIARIGRFSIFRIRRGDVQLLSHPVQGVEASDGLSSTVHSLSRWRIEPEDLIITMDSSLESCLSSYAPQKSLELSRLNAHECCTRLAHEALCARATHAMLAVIRVQ